MMTRQRIHLLVTLLVVGLMCITSFSASAQDEPEPERESGIVVTAFRRSVTYVAPTADGTTDIHVLELLDQAGIVDHDNDPNTPRVIEEGSYEITNITNTPGVNEIDPQFSPLGNQILYRGEADPTTYPGVNSLFVVESDGENPVQITPNGVSVFYGTFSPDGTRVAYMAQWGSREFKIFASDSNGENPVALTPGEGFNAAFPLWRWNETGAEEIDYLRFDGAASQVVGIDPQTAEELWSTDPVNQQWWILQPFAGEFATFIQRENSDTDWEIATFNFDTREVAQLTDNTTNDCCLAAPTIETVSGVDRTVDGDNETPRRRLVVVDDPLFLSDTEDGGRDIYAISQHGANPVNLTANDDREYTSVEIVTGHSLLVGIEEGGRRQLGFIDPETGEFTYLTDGSDPDVVDPISLEQLEGFAAAGLLQTCTFTFDYGEEITVEGPKPIFSEPREGARIVRQINPGDTVQVNAFLPDIRGGWYRLTDGTWILEVNLKATGDCPPLPTISRYSL